MKSIVFIVSLLIISGCATKENKHFIFIDDACSWVYPITVSEYDSPETVRQVLVLDKALKVNCSKRNN